jgi:hypothetical protein
MISNAAIEPLESWRKLSDHRTSRTGSLKEGRIKPLKLILA